MSCRRIEWQARAVAGALGDQPQLFRHSEVVVVAVEDHRVGRLEDRERPDDWSRDQLERRFGLGELDEQRPRIGVDRDDPLGADVLAPGEQLPGEEAVLGPHLDDRSRFGGFEAPEHDLGEIRERAVEAVQLVRLRPSVLAQSTSLLKSALSKGRRYGSCRRNRIGSVLENEPEELLRALLLGVVEHLSGRPLLDDRRRWSMKTTRVPTSRAKPISWVTTIIVIPSAASSRMTSSTSLTSSGSSAEVTSSKSITWGSIASARAIATRCC